MDMKSQSKIKIKSKLESKLKIGLPASWKASKGKLSISNHFRDIRRFRFYVILIGYLELKEF